MALADGNENGGNTDGVAASDKPSAKSGFTPGASFVVQPADVTGRTDPGGSSPADKPKRGRKPGSTNKPRTAATEKNPAVDKNALRDLILFAHTILEQSTKIPEFKMDAAEADAIASASVNVLRHYDIGQQSQKAMDWIALIGAVGIVYGPRVMSYRNRVMNAARPNNVQPLRSAP